MSNNLGITRDERLILGLFFWAIILAVLNILFSLLIIFMVGFSWLTAINAIIVALFAGVIFYFAALMGFVVSHLL